MSTLGRAALASTPLVCGTSSLGAGSTPGSAEERAAIDLALAMIDSEIALVDTSNAYAGGRSEAVLGAALAERPGNTARIVTKVDRAADGTFDRDRVLRSFDESCIRLGVERISLLHLHDPYTVSFEDAMASGGAVSGLLELRESGRVGAIGIAAGRLEITRRYVETGLFDALLTHNRYTLVERTAEPLLERARSLGMGTFNAAPFGGGLLSRGARSGRSYGYRPASEGLLASVAAIETLCARHGTTLPAAALQFSVRSPLVDATVVGMSRPARIAQLLALSTEDIPQEFWSELDALVPPGPVLPD